LIGTNVEPAWLRRGYGTDSLVHHLKADRASIRNDPNAIHAGKTAVE
jgi:hypothetical protein